MTALSHLDGSFFKEMQTANSGMSGRIDAIETWRANKSAAIAKLSVSPSVTGVSVLGFTVPTKASIDGMLATIHGKINEICDLATARELTN